MYHDYAHCWDYEKGVCPEDCFRAKITDDLKNWPYPVAYSKFKGTEACPLTHPQQKHTNADRIRAMTDEELAEWFLRIQYDVSDYFCVSHSCELTLPSEKGSWLGWLKQEAK